MSDYLNLPPWHSRLFIPPGYISTSAAALMVIAINRAQYTGDWMGPIEVVVSEGGGNWQNELAIEVPGTRGHPELIWPPLRIGFECLQEAFPGTGAVDFAEFSLNDFRADLSAEKIRSCIIHSGDGVLTGLPGSYWNTFAANSVLWDDALVEFFSGEGWLSGHAVIAASEFERYLSARDDQAWGFRIFQVGVNKRVALMRRESECELVDRF